MYKNSRLGTASLAALVFSTMGLAAACGDGSGDDGTGGMGGEGSGGKASGGTEAGGSGGSEAGGTGGEATGGAETGGTGGAETGGTGGSGAGGGDTGGMGGLGGMGGESGEFSSISEVVAKKVDVAAGLQAVSVTEDGLVYAAGVRVENTGTSADPVDDAHVVVARFSSDGDLDESFGDEGVVLINVIAVDGDDATAETPGDESASGIVALADGGAAVSINANDGALGRAVYVVRLNAAGNLVASFGDDGIAEVPLTDWEAGQDWLDAGGTDVPSDSSYDIRLDTSGSEDRLVLFGSAPARQASGRVDPDRYVARLLLSDGSLDASFADAGSFSIDFGNNNLSDGGRRGAVLEDGAIYSFGYTVLGDARHHIFILKLDDTGTPDADFGFRADDAACGDAQDGVICSNPNLSVGGFAEAYGAAVQSDGSIVTTGYGRADDQSLEPDLVSFRFEPTEMDSSYGTAGGLIIDSGAEDRGRDAVGLSDDRVVHVGKYGGVAAVYVTDPNGTLWAGFGDGGIESYAGHDGNFRGVATNGTLVAAVADGGTDTSAFLAIFEVAD